MKRLTTVFILLLLLTAPLIAGDKEDAAAKSAESWLALVDSGNYNESWEQTAAMFKKAVPKPEWSRMLGAARTPLGALKSRKLRGATYTTSLPGAPDGEYVVLQFDSAFENKKSAVETVTPRFEDGKWKVGGYFIK